MGRWPTSKRAANREGRGEGPRTNVWGRVDQLVVGCIVDTEGEGTLGVGNINHQSER